MHMSARTGPVTKIGVHTNEGPETPGTSAESLRSYLWNNGPDGGGYQAVADDNSVSVVVGDGTVCWANGGVNDESIDICIIGYAAQTPMDWDDAFDRGALENAAQWVAGKCREYDIPAIRLTPIQLLDSNAKGIFGHIDVTNAGYVNSAGHTDPGPNFPWTKFLARVNQILIGGEPRITLPSDEEYEDMIIVAPAWMTKDPNRPACVRLDVAAKRVGALNGAQVVEFKTAPSVAVPVPVGSLVRGWFETFHADGSKEGFTVIGSKDASGNPAYHYQWVKRP